MAKEPYKTIADRVSENAAELSQMEDFLQLYRWAKAHGVRRTGFAQFKEVILDQLGIDYDALSSAFKARRAALIAKAEAISAATPLVIPSDAIIGWRAFAPRNTRPRNPADVVDLPGLTSLHFPVHYRPNAPFVAACVQDLGHDAPNEACGCGIWSNAYLSELSTPTPSKYLLGECEIYGDVAHWGRVIRTERGVRSEYAYPLALYTNCYTAICQAFCPTYPLSSFQKDSRFCETSDSL